MYGRVTTHKEFLQTLHKLNPKYREAILKTCSDEEINCICECIFNILQGKIPLQEKEKTKLLKHKNTLRQLVSKGKHKLRKKVIVQKGGAFLPIILGAVLSSLLGSII